MRTVEDVRTLLKAGADKVGINTAAIENPDFVKEAAERFGSQCIVVAVDVKREYNDLRAGPFILRRKEQNFPGCQGMGQTNGTNGAENCC